MEKRVIFKHKFLPYLLVAPQIIITLVVAFLASLAIAEVPQMMNYQGRLVDDGDVPERG